MTKDTLNMTRFFKAGSTSSPTIPATRYFTDGFMELIRYGERGPN
jgi:hypothetical protein